MRSIAGRSLSLIATLLLLFGLAGPSQASLVVTLVPTASTDLSNVHVGDTLRFLTIGSSDAAVDEFLTQFPDIHLLGSGTGDLEVVSAFGLVGWNSLLDTSPALIQWTLRATVAGSFDLYNGFPDCNGLPGDSTGCAVTNLGATRPDDSNHLRFTIYEAPEPSSVALAVLGFLALGFSRRRKS